jgi:hypothetical protein
MNGSPSSPDPEAPRTDTPEPPTPPPPVVPPAEARIPAAKHARYGEVAALLVQFGQSHLDPELTGFTLELWARICRRRHPDCLRGQPTIWAATVVHVVARMNFLFDRGQPVHLTFDTICGTFGTNKTTVRSKATEIERTLRLSQHAEPGLCRRQFIEDFTTLQLSNGLVVTLGMARQMGFVLPDERS